jgi:hypothetical protein
MERKPTWSAVKSQIKNWDQKALLALIKDLHDANKANRDFLYTRCLPEESGGTMLENYRKKIVDQFFPARGEAKLKLGEARKAIRDYGKASKNIEGVAELLMTYVESGAEFTYHYGDIDEDFYNSIESALEELATLLRGSAQHLYPKLSGRLDQVEHYASPVGWGFCDTVSEIVEELRETCS